MLGVECPECGDLRTGVAKAGLDVEGHRIRGRQCRNCDHTFTTIEVPIPFVFNRMDVMKTEYGLDRLKRIGPKVQYRASPRRLPDHFESHTFEGDQRHSQPKYGMTITFIPGSKSDRCRKGLHLLVGRNVFRRPDGARQCRECINARNRERRREFRRRFPALAHEQDAVKRQKQRERRAAAKALAQEEAAAA